MQVAVLANAAILQCFNLGSQHPQRQPRQHCLPAVSHLSLNVIDQNVKVSLEPIAPICTPTHHRVLAEHCGGEPGLLALPWLHVLSRHIVLLSSNYYVTTALSCCEAMHEK